MIYFCADDYGLSAYSNKHIEDCFQKGILNKISVMPNGQAPDLKKHLDNNKVHFSLHLNLVEGRPLSSQEDVPLLISKDGNFNYSFIGLFFHSLSPKRKELENQIYRELKAQIQFWKNTIGENTPISIDSHQHTHMIPLIFKTLMLVINDENLIVSAMRIPAEPISPYILTPSLYFKYRPVSLIKQWLLKILALVNRKELKKSKIPSAYFMGILFSGNMNEIVIKKILPKYLKLAEKNNKNIEIGFHPGYISNKEELFQGCRDGFKDFYLSPLRKVEYDTLMNLNF